MEDAPVEIVADAAPEEPVQVEPDLIEETKPVEVNEADEPGVEVNLYETPLKALQPKLQNDNQP